jgi:transcriptional regulator with XRE-family HTH domain
MEGTALASAIRSFRLRRQQIHNGQPWTIEDLAVAMGADRAHLSRIERGLIIPNRGTLLRIARALDLSWSETNFLLRVGGSAPIFGEPDEEATREAIRWVVDAVRAYAHPVVLHSLDLRAWYANALWLRIMGLTPAEFRRCLKGREILEGMHGRCRSQQRVGDRFRNVDNAARASIARYRAAVTGVDPSPSLPNYLRDDARLRRFWEEAQDALPQLGLAGEQSRTELWYPGYGLFVFDLWWCPLQIDGRFVLTHYLPHDVATREAVSAIRREPRPTAGPRCEFHANAAFLKEGQESTIPALQE